MSATALASEPPPRPLLVTADRDLFDVLARLCAAAGVTPDVAGDVRVARARWTAAPLILLGIDALTVCVRARLPRRPGIILVSLAEVTAVWAETDALAVEHVVRVPDAEPWLIDRIEELRHPAVSRGRVVAVLGGRGGAGASVFATGLAVTGRRRGLDTLLVDSDPLGGGVDLVLGWEQRQGLRWSGMRDARGEVHPRALVQALPGQGTLAVLSFDRSELPGVPVEAMAATLDAGRRGRDLVVVDLPRRFDDPALLALATADRAFLVVPAELRACVAAKRVAATAAEYCPSLAVVVRGPAPGRLTPAEVAKALGLPLAGTLRPEPRLIRDLERGEAPAARGRGPLAELCGRIIGELISGAGRVLA